MVHKSGDGTIITCESPVTLFIEGTYICKRPFFGDFTRVKRLLEEMSKTGPNSVASSFRTLG